MREVILGIDPGLRNTGVGVIRTSPLRLADYHHITTKSKTEAESIYTIYTKLKHYVEKYEPNYIIYERASKNYYNVIVQTIIELVGKMYDKPVYYYAPVTVKKCVTGNHRADKIQVAKVVKALLEMNEGKLADHITDALAVAVCFYYKELIS